MRILLTGASGQVGSELRVALAALGEVIAPPRSVLDLASADSIANAVREARPAIIVNAAAYTAVDRAESEPETAMAVNGRGPGVLAEEAERGAAALVHFSTDYVFDGAKADPYDEDDATAPLNVYGASKLAGERAVLGTTAPRLVFRTGWIYGIRGRNFLLSILEKLHRGERLEVVDDQYGAPTRARSVAIATARIIGGYCTDGRLDSDRLLAASGLYHMTAAGRTSWHGFATEILKMRGARVTVSAVASGGRMAAARRPRNSVLSNARLRARFGVALPEWTADLHACHDEIRMWRAA